MNSNSEVLEGGVHTSMRNQYSLPQNQTAHDLFTREGTLGSRRLKTTVLTVLNRLQYSEKQQHWLKIINLVSRNSLTTVDYGSMWDRATHISSYPENLEWEAQTLTNQVKLQKVSRIAHKVLKSDRWTVEFCFLKNYRFRYPELRFKATESKLH